jgi:lipid II:glycine glycyltransferase (peptidoglycan interpeptide bridge formation enzyme)
MQAAWSPFARSRDEWDKLVIDLGAPILHQCFAWGEYRRCGGWIPLRICARNDKGKIVAACQLLTKRKYGVTVVWLPGGPSGDISCVGASFMRALRTRLGSLVYLRMNALRAKAADDEASLLQQGWRRPRARLGSGLSLDFDLRLTEDERLKNASGNWRHNLRRSTKYGLRIEQWENPEVSQVAALYREMEEIKGKVERVSESELEPLLRCVGDHLLVYRALDANGQMIAIRAAAVFGSKAWDIIAAAGATARKTYATHATFWRLAEACRDRGAENFDMGGADPVGNPGVFNFKKGTGAVLTEYLGEWEYPSFGFLRPLANIAMSQLTSAKPEINVLNVQRCPK